MALLSRTRNSKSRKPDSKPASNHAASTRRPRLRGPLYVHVAILQNGELLTESSEKIRDGKKLTLSSHPNASFSVPHYPLPDGKLEIAEIHGQTCILNAESIWEGICASRGNVIEFSRFDAVRKHIEIGLGDYASVIRGDLRILIRVDQKPPRLISHKTPPIKSLKKEWRSPFFRNFLTAREEVVSLAIAGFAAIVLVGSLCLGLGSRNVNRPKAVDDIKDTYMLSFVSPQHLESAPEILQSKLHRQAFLRSVIKYYQAFASLLSGEEKFDRQLLLPTTVSLFDQLQRDTQVALESKIRQQHEIDGEQSRLKDAATLSIPSVLGPTNASKIQTILDKIDIMQTASELNLAAKRKIITEFNEDDPYDYDNYRNLAGGAGKPKVPDAIKQIHVWGNADAEEGMYLEAKSLAKAAKSKQERWFANSNRSPLLTPSNSSPVELPAGTKYMSFLDDIDFFLADEKIDQVQAVEWGVPKPQAKQKEALVGEIDPSLIESYIKQNRYQLQLCYELALRRNESASGTMEWRWRIDSRGSISDIALVASAIKDQNMIQCIQRKIATWRFPRPRHGSVEVSYPFDFNPSKG